MREIEFRAYIKDIKKIVDIYNIDFLQETISFTNPYDTKYTSREFNQVELMQYTGLCDKKGTKIFEGDIVEMHYFFENHDPSTLGVFEDEAYIKGYLQYDELGLVLIDKNHKKCRVSEYVQEPCEELEIIGNIHDTPELLTHQHEDKGE